MKYREFSDLGWKVSEIGIGCWAIGSEWGNVSENDAKEALYAVSYTHLTLPTICSV